MPDPFMLLALFVLFGLGFVLLIGRRRHTGHGTVDTPAPGSPESPLFGEPEKKPVRQKAKRQ